MQKLVYRISRHFQMKGDGHVRNVTMSRDITARKWRRKCKTETGMPFCQNNSLRYKLDKHAIRIGWLRTTTPREATGVGMLETVIRILNVIEGQIGPI